MVQPARHKAGKFTYSDYLGWPDDERWELIDGEAWDMSPSPGTAHQRISLVFSGELYSYFRDKPCEVFAAPFDVVLTEHDVVQPDVLVVCDPAKITEQNIAGAPDLVAEILSPSTAAKDRREKLRLYERHGVREYLAVHPADRCLDQYVLGADGRYPPPAIVADGEVWKSVIFQGLEIELSRVFGG